MFLATFVECDRFAGTCFRAANWTCVGETVGRGKRDRLHNRPTTAFKSIWVRPVNGRATPTGYTTRSSSPASFRLAPGEAGVRIVNQERLKNACMHGSVSSARTVLALRAAALSPRQRRQSFWANRPSMERPAIRDLAPLRKVA